MAKNKLFACVLAGTLALALTACGTPSSSNSTTTAENTTTTAAKEEPTSGAVVTPAGPASIDFEDGKCAFVAPYYNGAGASDEVAVSVVDFNGSKALKIDNVGGKTPYIGIDVTSLLGDKVADVATISADFGVSYADGSFAPVVGVLTTWTGEKLKTTDYKWTVYLESKNPYTNKVSLKENFVAGAKNIFTVGLNTTANGVDAAKVKTATIYVDNIRFLDADGKLIEANSAAEFDAPDGFEASGEADRSNLYTVTDAVVFPDFATSGDGWGQNGFEMPQEIIDALVPGSVVEAEFASEDGTLWIVMPDAAKGWSRCGQGTAFINNSKNVAQITYEQIAAVCGDDVSTWGARMQFESQTKWSVSSVKVGKKSETIVCANPVVFEGFETSGDGWGQNGFEMPEAIVNALVPGAVVEIDYASEDGTLWIVMPDAAKGWSRCGQGTAVCTGSKCYVTYEQIAEVCGDDVSTWGARMQMESQTKWSVTGVRVGKAAKLPVANSSVVFEGFETSGDGWGQNGFEMPEAIVSALVPGATVAINYASEDGTLWIVMPDAAKGWSRCGQGTAVCTGSVCYVTYEQIAEVCGDDVSTWGARMQCESQTKWSVTGVSVISVK